MKKLLIITLIIATVGVGSLHARLLDKAKEAVQKAKKKHDAFITSVAKQPAIQKAAQQAHAIGAGMKIAAQPALGLMLPIAPVSMTQLKKEIDKSQKDYRKLRADFRKAHRKKNIEDVARLRRLMQANRARFRILNAKLLRQPVKPLAQPMKKMGKPVQAGKLTAQPTTTHGGPATMKKTKGYYSVKN